MQRDICRGLKGSHWSRNFLLGWAWRKIVQSLLTRLAFWKMVKMVSPITCREGARCWFQWWRTDINMSKFVVVSKQYFTKFRSGQRPPEAKGIARDDVMYPIYWINCQKCAILGKASKHVVSCHVYHRRLTCLWRGATAEQLPVFQTKTPSLTLKGIRPARDRVR